LVTLWDDPPGSTSAIVEVFTTLKQAFLAAEHYIYIEDQYLDDPKKFGVPLTGDPFWHYWTLLPHLAAAAKARDVKLIFLGSGRGDPNDPEPQRGPQNVTFGGYPQKIANQLTANGIDPKDRIALWRLKPATVHSKCVLIDDRFAAIGSANLMSRSMSGEDSELHVAVVDEGNLLRDFRVELWAEHHNIPAPRSAGVMTALQEIDTAVGLWRRSWLPSGSTDLWSAAGKPPGFAPAPNQIELVGPS
jgi:phosphatidylserine/phosphatidylglycerophosphate/cardiolipin synthase-like enzyme